MKVLRPVAIETAPPGEVSDGAGGARKRMKNAHFSTSLSVSSPVAASTLVASFGTGLNPQPARSSRSIGKPSFEMPISTLYASAENTSSEGFCAFQPKRPMRPSLPLMLTLPPMPSACLLAAPIARFFRIVVSGMDSIRPRPKVGVGMRRLTLLLATWVAKSSCAMLQVLLMPPDNEPSSRNVITNSEWTPPSAVPAGVRLKRASLTGPLPMINGGRVLRMPKAVATATCGLVVGEVPPSAGWVWHPPQLSRLKRGPMPSARFSASANVTWPSVKKAISLAVMLARWPPSDPVRGRGPGSAANAPVKHARKIMPPHHRSGSIVRTLVFMEAFLAIEGSVKFSQSGDERNRSFDLLKLNLSIQDHFMRLKPPPRASIAATRHQPRTLRFQTTKHTLWSLHPPTP